LLWRAIANPTNAAALAAASAAAGISFLRVAIAGLQLGGQFLCSSTGFPPFSGSKSSLLGPARLRHEHSVVLVGWLRFLLGKEHCGTQDRLLSARLDVDSVHRHLCTAPLPLEMTELSATD
jgi:hypothetical protein